MWYPVRDLDTQQRHVLETLLGRGLTDDECVTIYPSRLVKEAPTGEARTQAYAQLISHLDRISSRVPPERVANIEDLIDEACEHARHS